MHIHVRSIAQRASHVILYTYTHIHTYVRTYIYIYIYIYIYMHIHVRSIVQRASHVILCVVSRLNQQSEILIVSTRMYLCHMSVLWCPHIHQIGDFSTYCYVFLSIFTCVYIFLLRSDTCIIGYIMLCIFK